MPTPSAWPRQYLSYFQGPTTAWACADQRLLRASVPEDRLRVYDVRQPDRHPGRHRLGAGAPRRVRPPAWSPPWSGWRARAVGVVANDPGHLGGAIDSDGADKAARFLQLCDAHDIPILFLCDTPGFMVGPEAETDGPGPALQPAVRHRGQPHRALLHHRGAQGVRARGPGHGRRELPRPRSSWWPGRAASSGGMGLEGAVRLGFRRELEAVDDPRSGRPCSSTWSNGPTATGRRQCGLRLRDRRRHRSGRLEAADRRGPAVDAASRPDAPGRSAAASTPGERHRPSPVGAEGVPSVSSRPWRPGR